MELKTKEIITIIVIGLSRRFPFHQIFHFEILGIPRHFPVG